jgi:hypothetical protein
MEPMLKAIDDALRRIPPWLATVRCAGLPFGRYRYFPSSPRRWCVYASMEGLFVECLLGMADRWTEAQRREAMDGLLECQAADGYFHCPGCAADDRDPRQRCTEANADGITFKASTFLYSVGEKPRYPLPAGKFGLELDSIESWLAATFASENPYSAGSTVWKGCGMRSLYLLSNGKDPLADPLVARIMDWLVRNQDPDTGLWFHRGDLLNGMNGLLKLRFGTFDLVGLEIPRPEQIVRAILGIQKTDGSYGGACCDWNAAGLLAEIGCRVPRYRRDIIAAYRRLLPVILSKQRPSGGLGSCKDPAEEAGLKYTFVNLCGLLSIKAFLAEDDKGIDLVFGKGLRRRLLGRVEK